MLSWSHDSASGSNRRSLSRITASTQRVRPAVQSFALEGSNPVARLGSNAVQATYGGSSARAALGAASRTTLMSSRWRKPGRRMALLQDPLTRTRDGSDTQRPKSVPTARGPGVSCSSATPGGYWPNAMRGRIPERDMGVAPERDRVTDGASEIEAQAEILTGGEALR